jgi:hypothetical protein
MREAVESYAADVREVAAELASASDVPAFAAALRELIEVAACDRPPMTGPRTCQSRTSVQ